MPGVTFHLLLCCYAEYRFAECCYAECLDAWNVVKLNAVILRVVAPVCSSKKYLKTFGRKFSDESVKTSATNDQEPRIGMSL
jgi:hypothetical protein